MKDNTVHLQRNVPMRMKAEIADSPNWNQKYESMLTASDTDTTSHREDGELPPLVPFLEFITMLGSATPVDPGDNSRKSSSDRQAARVDMPGEDRPAVDNGSPSEIKWISGKRIRRVGLPDQIAIPSYTDFIQSESQPRLPERETYIFDPVEPLVQGSLPLLTPDDALQQAVDRLEVCLKEHLATTISLELQESFSLSSTSSTVSMTNGATATILLVDDHVEDNAVQRACRLLEDFPDAGQICYQPLPPLPRRRPTHTRRDSSSRHCGSTSTASSHGSTTTHVWQACSAVSQASSTVGDLTSTSASASTSTTSYKCMHSSVCRSLCGTICYPLTLFSVTGNLPGVQASYHAFPEAAAHVDEWLGTALHYACHHHHHHNNNEHAADVILFLLDQYPEAARSTNEKYRTPLHLACSNAQTLSIVVLEALLDAYPAAAQLADVDGYTPFHFACESGASAQMLELLLNASGCASACSSAMIRASTRTLAKPLHMAAGNNAAGRALEVVDFLLKKDPSQASATDEVLRTPLHKACMTLTVSLEVVQRLVAGFPQALGARDINGERPYDLAVRLGGASPAVLQLLR